MWQKETLNSIESYRDGPDPTQAVPVREQGGYSPDIDLKLRQDGMNSQVLLVFARNKPSSLQLSQSTSLAEFQDLADGGGLTTVLKSHPKHPCWQVYSSLRFS